MIAVFALTCFVAVSGPEHSDDTWPLWRAYVAHFVSANDRVIDRTSGDRTTSAIRTYLWAAMLSPNDPQLQTMQSALGGLYDQNLVLFDQGFTQGRYHFAVNGALYSRWESQCISQ